MNGIAAKKGNEISGNQLAVYVIQLLMKNMALERKLTSLDANFDLEEIDISDVLANLPTAIRSYLIRNLSTSLVKTAKNDSSETDEDDSGVLVNKKPKKKQYNKTEKELEAAECLSTLSTLTLPRPIVKVEMNNSNVQQTFLNIAQSSTTIPTINTKTATITTTITTTTTNTNNTTGNNTTIENRRITNRQLSSEKESDNVTCDGKYLDRRAKNNFAARKCRERKRRQQLERLQQNGDLASENCKLKAELKVLEGEYNSLKKLIELKARAKERGEKFELPPLNDGDFKWQLNGSIKESSSAGDYQSSDDDRLIVDTSV